MVKTLTAQRHTAQETPQRREPVGVELREAIIVAYVEGGKTDHAGEERQKRETHGRMTSHFHLQRADR